MTNFRIALLVAATLAGPLAAVSPGYAFEPPRSVYVPPMPTVQMPQPQAQRPVWDDLRIPRPIETVPETPSAHAVDDD